MVKNLCTPTFNQIFNRNYKYILEYYIRINKMHIKNSNNLISKGLIKYIKEEFERSQKKVRDLFNIIYIYIYKIFNSGGVLLYIKIYKMKSSVYIEINITIIR